MNINSIIVNNTYCYSYSDSYLCTAWLCLQNAASLEDWLELEQRDIWRKPRNVDVFVLPRLDKYASLALKLLPAAR